MKKLLLCSLVGAITFSACTNSAPKELPQEEPQEMPAEDVAEEATPDLWNEILSTNVSEDGVVNYEGIAADRARFDEYINEIQSNPPVDGWSDAAVISYWINTYNAFTIQLILDNWPLNSITDIEKPWDLEFIPIGNQILSLNYIENQILRADFDEERVHFGVNCASISCPKLSNRSFTEENLEEQLEMLAKAFVNDPTRNEIAEGQLAVSKIFDWYGEDFISDEQSLIDWLNKYSQTTISAEAKVGYKEYNWNLNSAAPEVAENDN